MRARNLKPTFFKNPDLADLGPIAQLLFAGLWCLADKEGRLKDQPRVIKAEVFPYYDTDVNGELTKLERLGFIRRYVAFGIAVIEVLSFRKHQSPHHTEKASDLPAFIEKSHTESMPRENHRDPTVDPPLQDGGNPSDSLTPDSLTHDSGNSRAREEGGREVSRETEVPASTPSPALAACLLLREHGFVAANPMHPDLLAAVAAGITPETLLATAQEFRDKPLRYWVRAAIGRRDEQARAPPASVTPIRRWEPDDEDDARAQA